MDVTGDKVRELSDEEYKAEYNPTTTVYVDNVVPPLGLSLTGVYKKVNFNKKDFYEAIQPVTEHYKGITDINRPSRPTPPLLDISKRWETDDLYSTGEPGRKNTRYLEHIDAVDDLFTLLYSFKGLLDTYPPGADYSTPGLKTTFELLWGEIWAYYVTIPRVTFSWVYWDILHCIEAAAPGTIKGLQESSLPFGGQETYDSDGITGGTPVVPQGFEGGEEDVGGSRGFRDIKTIDTPEIRDVLAKELKKLGQETVEVGNSKTDALERLRKVLKELDTETGKIYNRILTQTEIIPDLKIYTGRLEISDEPLKSNIHLIFKQVYGEPRLYQKAYDFKDHSAPYYLAKIAVDNGGVNVLNKISLEGYVPLRETIQHFTIKYKEPIRYLYKGNDFSYESFQLRANIQGVIRTFMTQDLLMYFVHLIGDSKIDSFKLTLEVLWKIYNGVYNHFTSSKVQENMQQYVTDNLKSLLSGEFRSKREDIPFEVIIPSLKEMIEGPIPPP